MPRRYPCRGSGLPSVMGSPVSSCTSRTAVCGSGSPGSAFPFGSVQSSYFGRCTSSTSGELTSPRQTTRPAARITSSGINRPPSAGLQQLALHVDERTAVRGPDRTVPLPVSVKLPRCGRLRCRHFHQTYEIGDVPRICHLDERLDPAIEVAVHEIRTPEPPVGCPAVLEDEDPRMLEETPEDTADPDRRRQVGDARPHPTYAAYTEIDRNAGKSAPVQRVNHHLVDD